MSQADKKIVITQHFRDAYLEHVGLSNDDDIIAHLRSAVPATDLELAAIRGTKRQGRVTISDSGKATHLIDRDIWVVFVAVDEAKYLTAVTCYETPYLKGIDKCIPTSSQSLGKS